MVSQNAVSAATIEVFRDTQDDVQDRWVRLFVDDDPAEILRYGETFRRQVAPGQTLRIRCHNHFAKGGILMMLTIGFAFIKVRLEIVPG